MNFEAVKASLVAEAERLEIQEYDVFFMESESRSTETLKDEISSFSCGVSGGVAFRCVVDGHMGCASTECLTEEEMKALVCRAFDNAKNLESKDEAVIFEGSKEYPKVSACDTNLPSTSDMKEVALALQKKTYAESESVTDGTQSGVFAERFSMSFLNSRGLSLSHSAGVGGAYVQAVVHQNGESQSAFDFCVGVGDADTENLPKRVVEEALAELGAKEIESGRYDVILCGKQMRAMLSAFSSVFSAKNAQLGLSLFRDKEGQTVAAECVTLVDDPLREDCPMKIPFDGEGVATYRKNVIERGVLGTLLYDLATAKKKGIPSTGNGLRGGYAEAVSIRPYSFYFEPGTETRDELFAALGNGLYITELKGLHAGANAVTGDFSIESAGFMIRDGKKAEAIRSFTIAGNFFEFLKNIERMGDTVHFGMPGSFTVYGSPDVLIRNVSVAGK